MANDSNNFHTILGADDVPVCKLALYLQRTTTNQAKTATTAQMPNIVHVRNEELYTKLSALISQMQNLNDQLQARSQNRETILDIGTSEFENSVSMRDIDKAEVEQYMKEIIFKVEEKVKAKVSETIEKIEAYEEERFAIRLEAFRKDQVESIKQLRNILIRMHVLDGKTQSSMLPLFDPKNGILWDLLQRHIVAPLQQAQHMSRDTSSKSQNTRKPNFSTRCGKQENSLVSEAQITAPITSGSDYEPDSPILKKSVFAPAVTTRAGYGFQLVIQASKSDAKRKHATTYQPDVIPSSKSSDNSEKSEEVPRIANGRFSLKNSSTGATTPISGDTKNTASAPESKKRVWKESYSRGEGQKKKPRTEFQRMIDMSKGKNVSLEKKEISGYGYYNLKQDSDL